MSTRPTPETVEVDFIAPRHLACASDPAWFTVLSTNPMPSAPPPVKNGRSR
ncbi:hypothetical protein AB0E85_20870 [Streptomyces sp. NPDC029044]|uniref:hypothetical protein n=1 Tax=Streptomyces sp. NPDC029044 TaxID=3157198 RepID=UPI0033FAF134